MMKNGLSDAFIKSYKRLKTWSIITSTILLLSIITLILNVTGILGSILLFEFVVFAIIFSAFFAFVLIVYWVYMSKRKDIVGQNFTYDISQDGIIIADVAEGMSIEKTFSWSDISYINKVCYNEYTYMYRFFYGLQFVIDEDEFFQSLEKRKRKPEYSQRDEELNYGFFIVCDLDYARDVEKLWGGEIR